MKLRVIYEPKGRAREYAELAVSLYRGCDHRCAYCYSPNVLKMKREEFVVPAQRPGLISRLTLDAIDLEEAGNTRPVLLSFTHDPYMLMDALLGERYGTEHSLTRQAVRILKHHGQRVSILTKGGLRATRDLDLLDEHDAFGCTLTFASEADSREWEPGAAMPSDRIDVLKQAHARGIPTWASIEPVIAPGQSVAMILASLPYVDTYKLGAWNYDKRANDIDWPAYYRRVRTLLRGEGKLVVVKADLLERAGVPA